jgi:hypothetical protein
LTMTSLVLDSKIIIQFQNKSVWLNCRTGLNLNSKTKIPKTIF